MMSGVDTGVIRSLLRNDRISSYTSSDSGTIEWNMCYRLRRSDRKCNLHVEVNSETRSTTWNVCEGMKVNSSGSMAGCGLLQRSLE